MFGATSGDLIFEVHGAWPSYTRSGTSGGSWAACPFKLKLWKTVQKPLQASLPTLREIGRLQGITARFKIRASSL